MPRAATAPNAVKTEPKKTSSKAQAAPVQKSDTAASKTRSRVLASIPIPHQKRGSDQAAPLRELMALNRINASPRGRTAGHLSGSDRGMRCPTGVVRRESDVSRPRPVGGVNELVKNPYIDPTRRRVEN